MMNLIWQNEFRLRNLWNIASFIALAAILSTTGSAADLDPTKDYVFPYGGKHRKFTIDAAPAPDDSNTWKYFKGTFEFQLKGGPGVLWTDYNARGRYEGRYKVTPSNGQQKLEMYGTGQHNNLAGTNTVDLTHPILKGHIEVSAVRGGEVVAVLTTSDTIDDGNAAQATYEPQ